MISQSISQLVTQSASFLKETRPHEVGKVRCMLLFLCSVLVVPFRCGYKQTAALLYTFAKETVDLCTVCGVVEFKPHHRGHGAYTWPPTIRSAEPSKALTSTKCCPQPQVERGTSKVLQNGTGSRPHLQGRCTQSLRPMHQCDNDPTAACGVRSPTEPP